MEKNKSLANWYFDISVKLYYNSLSVANKIFWWYYSGFDYARATKRISAPLEGGKFMSEVKVKENESLISALRHFKRSCRKNRIWEKFVKRTL